MAFKRKFRSTKRSWKRKTVGRFNRKGKTFATRVKRVIMKTAETKYLMNAAENVALYHDRGTSAATAVSTNEGALIFNPWLNITKGNSVNTRIADEIYPTGMALRLMCWNTPGRAAQFIRIVIAVVPKVMSNVVLDGGNFDLMDASGSNDTVTGMIKKEGVKVLYDKMTTFKASGSTDAAATSGDNRFFRKLYIKSKRGQKITWGQDGYITNKPVGIWVIPYDEYGSLRTDNILGCSYTYKLYFKDV